MLQTQWLLEPPYSLYVLYEKSAILDLCKLEEMPKVAEVATMLNLSVGPVSL